MSKNTTIIAQDNMSLKDETQFQSVAEAQLKSQGVDLENIKFDGLKTLKKEWYYDIIELNINNIKVKPTVFKRQPNNTYMFAFDTVEDKNLFYSYFTKEIFRSVNTFLEDQEYSVSKYNRILTFETVEDKLSLTLRW